ncbi:MAG: carbohydrate ABC transporter permease [Anaerolineae bacterium]|nr:carbohydrate ABC transporter permease [Anaerolineae bacterium]
MQPSPLRRVLLYVAAIVIAIWTTAPFVWLIISSLSYKVDLLQRPLRWIPTRITLENYTDLLVGTGEAAQQAAQFLAALKSSLIVALGATAICLVLGTFAGYALTRLTFPGSRYYLLILMAGQLLPPVTIVIPLYVILRAMDLLDKQLGLVIVYISFILPLVVWILRGYFASIPSELEDAARIDGTTRIGALFRIVLPLAGPGLASTAIFAFIAAWNEYLYAFVYSAVDAKTVPVLIGEFSTKLGLEYLRMAAAGVLAALPPVLLALIFQRFIIRGLTSGAVK